MSRRMSIPVLAYHGVNIHRNDYAGNDHIALREDLKLIRRLGLRVIPSRRIADWVSGNVADADVSGGVGISFDDGSWFDWHDLEHPSCGPQRSMVGILRDFGRETGQAACATSFVIASPEARGTLDKTCLIGRGWWGDEWWRHAVREGLIEIGNHSWDHLHPTLETVAHSRNVKDDFLAVDNLEDARRQVVAASREIARRSGRKACLFAYPCGQAPDYLVEDYLPGYLHEHGLIAAFTTEPRRVRRDDNVWRLPRLVCGEAWNSPEELEGILRAS